MVWVEAVIHVALEAVMAVEPRANANKHASLEPFRTVITRGRARVRSDVIVPIGTIRGDADFDADLSRHVGSGGSEADSSRAAAKTNNLNPRITFTSQPLDQVRAKRVSLEKCSRSKSRSFILKFAPVVVHVFHLPSRRISAVLAAFTGPSAHSQRHPFCELFLLRQVGPFLSRINPRRLQLRLRLRTRLAVFETGRWCVESWCR